MDKAKLEELIELGFSSYDIAKEMGFGQTTARYWLRKYGINTLPRKRQFKVKNPHITSINPNNYLSQKRRALTRKKEIIRLKGGKCVSCGYAKNTAALHFHHREPENKTFTLDSRKLSNTNWGSILLELEKCDLLCANCHAEKHSPDSELVVGAGNDPDGIEYNTDYESAASPCQPPPTF